MASIAAAKKVLSPTSESTVIASDLVSPPSREGAMAEADGGGEAPIPISVAEEEAMCAWAWAGEKQ